MNLRTAAILVLAGAGCRSGPNPGEANRLYQEGLHQLSTGTSPGEVLPLLDRAVRLAPTQGDYLIARAGIHQRLGRLDDALADYAAALPLLKTTGARATAHFDRAILHAEAGRDAEAERDLTVAIGLFPDYVEALLHRARIRRRTGRAPEADRDVAEARQRGKLAVESFYNAGVRDLKFGRLDEAGQYFGFALDLDPSHVGSHVAMGRIHMQRGRFTAAEASLSRAIELQPDDARLYYHRGNALLALERYPEAEADYTRAIEQDPGLSSAYASRGIARRIKLRDPDGAEADFQKAIGITPDHSVAHLNRALLHHEMGLLNDAERILRAALAQRATPESCRALGLVLHDKANFIEAVRLFRLALKIARDDEMRASIRADIDRSEAAGDEVEK